MASIRRRTKQNSKAEKSEDHVSAPIERTLMSHEANIGASLYYYRWDVHVAASPPCRFF